MPHHKIKLVDRFLEKTVLRVLPKWVEPNHITIFRFLTVPFVVLLLYVEEYLLGGILFTISAISDAVDGSLARTSGKITDWGKLYDPLADKLLIGSAAVIVVSKYLGMYLALLMILVELLFILGGFYRHKFEKKAIQAEITGKIKMVLQSVGIMLVLLYAMTSYLLFLTLGGYIIYLSVVFALWSLIIYRGI